MPEVQTFNLSVQGSVQRTFLLEDPIVDEDDPKISKSWFIVNPLMNSLK